MSKKLIIGIDITDWRDEMQRNEPQIIKSEDDVISLVVDQGNSTTQAAKTAVCQEEMRIAPQVLRPRKLQLLSGARQDVNTAIARRQREIETSSGKVFTVREFIGLPGKSPGDDKETELPDGLGKAPMAAFDSNEGIERAVHYLTNVVTGHIWKRLVQIAGAGGDATEAASRLKESIDGMVNRLVD